MADLVGFRVRNASRVLQIDGEYQNLELISKASYATSTNNGGLWGRYADVPVPAGRSNVVLAVSSTSERGLYVVRINASTFRVYSGDQGSGTISSFTAYMFATPIQPGSGFSIGLIVRSRITGEVVYNSNFKYLKVLSFRPVNLPMPLNAQSPPSVDSSLYQGKSVAIVQCGRPYGRRQVPGGTPQQPIGIFGFFGATMRTPIPSQALIENRVIASAIGPSGTSTAQVDTGTYLVIDVTEY